MTCMCPMCTMITGAHERGKTAASYSQYEYPSVLKRQRCNALGIGKVRTKCSASRCRCVECQQGRTVSNVVLSYKTGRIAPGGIDNYIHIGIVHGLYQPLHIHQDILNRYAPPEPLQVLA